MISSKDLTKGMMIILSSPSGAGKSTISRMLLENDQKLCLSISVTTRDKRLSEKEGVDYHFVSQTVFDQMLVGNQLLEYAKIYNNFYGTPRHLVDDKMKEGKDVLFDIDWQGSRQLYQNCNPQNIVSIFLLPPSMQELHNRLKKRAEDSSEVIAKRLSNAEQEIIHYKEYDYVLINENLEKTFEIIQNIINIERLKSHRQLNLKNSIKNLLEALPDKK